MLTNVAMVRLSVYISIAACRGLLSEEFFMAEVAKDVKGDVSFEQFKILQEALVLMAASMKRGVNTAKTPALKAAFESDLAGVMATQVRLSNWKA